MKIATLKKHFNRISLKTMTNFGLFMILQAHNQCGYQRPTSAYQAAIEQMNPETYTYWVNTRKNISLAQGGGFFIP